MLDALVGEAVRRFGLDVGAGIQVVAAERLTSTPIEASRPLLIVPLAMLPSSEVAAPDAGSRPGQAAVDEPLSGRHGPEGRDPIRLIARLYPAASAVGRLGNGAADSSTTFSATPAAGTGTTVGVSTTAGASTTVGELRAADLAGPLYLPPIAPELAAAGPWAMPYISARLRRPDGCPWDREQTHESLRKHLLEETYEVYDALERGPTPELADELGDLLLQVVLHAQLAAEAGVFDLADVQASIARKIVRRHPHVFGDAVARTAADVNRQWERIKADERAEAAAAAVDGSDRPEAPRSALDGISGSLPALAASQEMQERAAALGYDWPDIDGVLDKVAEELAELAEARDAADAGGADEARGAAETREEFGDLLLVIVNVGRKLGIESEAALRAANDKFRRRFRRVEGMVADRGVAIRDLDFEALDELWDAAKVAERAAAERAEVVR
jgi:MazG family protein